MLKICVEKWDKNSDRLKELIRADKSLNNCDYKDLVKLTIDTIFNDESDIELDIEKITEIDNGDYQGTLIYLIPFKTYQPCEYDYLMTYVGYGSCSGCDTLQAIQDWGDDILTDDQVKDFMSLCKDIITNMVKPYNNGWRNDDKFDTI